MSADAVVTAGRPAGPPADLVVPPGSSSNVVKPLSPVVDPGAESDSSDAGPTRRSSRRQPCDRARSRAGPATASTSVGGAPRRRRCAACSVIVVASCSGAFMCRSMARAASKDSSARRPAGCGPGRSRGAEPEPARPRGRTDGRSRHCTLPPTRRPPLGGRCWLPRRPGATSQRRPRRRPKPVGERRVGPPPRPVPARRARTAGRRRPAVQALPNGQAVSASAMRPPGQGSQGCSAATAGSYLRHSARRWRELVRRRIPSRCHGGGWTFTSTPGGHHGIA